LYKIVRRVGAQQTLEVGMAWGISTMAICQAHQDKGGGHHTAVDPFQGPSFKSLGLWNVKRAGLEGRLTFFEERSQIVLPRLVSEGRQYGVIFIDGSHMFDHAFVDFYFADRLIPVGGYLFFDDVWLPSIRKILQFALTNRHYEIDLASYDTPSPTWRRWREKLRHQLQRLFAPSAVAGVPPEVAFTGARESLGRNVNWCVLRKTGDDDRKFPHFVPF
jgi:hypothetical protein